MIMKAGEKAAFDGVLIKFETLALLIKTMEQEHALHLLDIENAYEIALARSKTELQKCENYLVLEKLKAESTERDFERRSKVYESVKNTSTPWYRSNYVSFLLGNVLAGGVCAAITATK